MSDVFYVRDVLGTLASVREIMRARALKIREAGGDPTVTEDQLERLEVLERFLCGNCNIVFVRRRLTDYIAGGHVNVSRAEVFKLMCGE